MWTYMLRRTLQGMLVLLLVSLVIFALVRSLPGDAILLQLDQAAALSKADLELARQELGIDRPFWQQYKTWMTGVLHGDLGKSLTSRKPVSQELGKRVALTFHLALMALLVALLIAIPIGIASAVWQDTVTDYIGRMFAILGLSFPDFWMATVAITFMAIWWHWMPPMGFEPVWIEPLKCVEQLCIPAVIIGARLSAVLMRMTRSALLEVLREDYIRTARAKGLRERAIIIKHGLKNACIPVVTLIGQQFSVLLGGAVIVEVIFLLPGVGSLTLDAVMLRDYTVVQGAVMFFATVMVGMNLLVDVSYAWFDPRIRYR
ncbi:MAG: ABC transporter permease [Candidatus Tectomicrobia bacterium]|uniref:ABC transporter permease n=1 Tax=Tectimicrobiota bacterium TaxID=2528274 RepID=A0A937VXL1_UNCTE|nr:ABC transporter permease [Candidatus Tectomicrobia bacterium]